MGANPMQKMKRNAILIGLIVGLVIGLILCGGVYVFLTKSIPNANLKSEDSIAVYVLNKSVKSGEKITVSDLSTKVMNKLDIPADATAISNDVLAKIDLSAGTILTAGMVNTQVETPITDDLREQEYNMITLPSKLSDGDFIDIRLQLPNGADYIVISKKQVLKCDASTIWLNMYEEEIELMSSAIIEYYIMTGSKLYATTYTEPGSQIAAVGTYVPNKAVSDLISNNPNIKNYINSDRYSEALRNIRNNNINPSINEYADTAIQNIEGNIQEEIENLKESREAYFGALNTFSDF